MPPLNRQPKLKVTTKDKGEPNKNLTNAPLK